MAETKREKRNRYQREWAKANPERIREYRVNLLRRRALADLLKETANPDKPGQTRKGEPP